MGCPYVQRADPVVPVTTTQGGDDSRCPMDPKLFRARDEWTGQEAPYVRPRTPAPPCSLFPHPRTLFAASSCAPASMRYATTARRFLEAATYSGVKPSCGGSGDETGTLMQVQGGANQRQPAAAW